MVAAVLDVQNLSVIAPNGTLLLDQISFSLGKGEKLGLIGASGSGKSMIAATLCGLLRPPLRVLSGKILLDGQNILAFDPKAWRSLRGSSIFQIFQSPATALSPAVKVGVQLKEAAKRAGRDSKSCLPNALDVVQLPVWVQDNYPYQLSGGMKQRVLIAMALILRPNILIADEPTTGLDVLTERDVLQALTIMAKETGASLLFISHDLRAVSHVVDHTLVLSCGQISDALSVADIGVSESPKVRELAIAARDLGLKC
ncbi:ATP-binding cassette domain-containing protein [Cohaesibacter celericrescens]|uniref:ATP-binding cassette domain-containing protein n=1 Tax=Cohaesibacter celericrescens TaxID=2067669 RepID=UPI0035643215